ncbi:MAG: S1 RNA-binding domain-containing protein, partial [Clostridia bacterium]|nr:S1 RNA-binding domain-containing protein [Clostridia bacterium]
MQIEVGAILEGKVTGITKFGAFVELAPGKTGMVHISEVANTYVKEITDHISEGQTVKVKVLSIGEDG